MLASWATGTGLGYDDKAELSEYSGKGGARLMAQKQNLRL